MRQSDNYSIFGARDDAADRGGARRRPDERTSTWPGGRETGPDGRRGPDAVGVDTQSGDFFLSQATDTFDIPTRKGESGESGMHTHTTQTDAQHEKTHHDGALFFLR